jgi:hypothetical protein
MVGWRVPLADMPPISTRPCRPIRCRPQNLSRRTESGFELNASQIQFADFRPQGAHYLQLSEWLAGDAVLIAPVSREFPC